MTEAAWEDFDVDRILATLNRHGVDYVVIGGMAVIAHGYIRATRDVDVMADQSMDNLERLAAALKELGARIEGIDGGLLPVSPTDPNDLANGANWTLMTDAGRLDYLPAASGARDYRLLVEDAREVVRSGDRPTFRVVGLDDLVAMKTAARRSKDYMDLANLGRKHPELGLGADRLEDLAAQARLDGGRSDAPESAATVSTEKAAKGPRWWRR